MKQNNWFDPFHTQSQLSEEETVIQKNVREFCEKELIQPTYITNYPNEMSPLSKKHRKHDGLTERFELFINGKEIANAYSEQNDPIEQRKSFEEQIEASLKCERTEFNNFCHLVKHS